MKKNLILIGLLAAASSAQAAGIGVRAGTMGVGADIAWNLAPALSARLGYSALDWDHDVSTDAVTYNGKLKLSNLNAFLEFHPLGPLFRITGGFVFHDNKYDVNAARFGGSLSGTVEPSNNAAPYLGIGWGTVAGAGINFYADLGIMFMGSPKARLTANCGSLSPAACGALQAEVPAEQRRLEDELKNAKYFPVLNVGLTIGF
jgi:hypothetical protein